MAARMVARVVARMVSSMFHAAGILPESLEIIQEIQQWLQPTDFAADSSEYKKHLNSYVVGTGNWIQRTETYQAWHDSPDSSSLWIKAIPGAGKSVFAAMIADKLSQSEKVPVLYFFFRQIIAKNHDPQYLVRDWLSQLLPYSPFLQFKLKRQMEEGQKLDDISIDELWHSLLLAMALIPKLYCVADALDEMDISKLGFLDRLVELGKQRHFTVKILMTSRPLPRIESKLRTPSVLEVSILQIRLQQNMVDTDIAIYVDHRLQQRNGVGLTDNVRETIRNAICSKGQGSFLYARLMMDKLLDDTTQISSSSADLERVMKGLPVSLEDMYNGMLLDHATRSGVPQELQLTILQWVTHSVRPLRLLELAAMTDSMDDIRERMSKDTKALVRTACGPLLEILEDETVSIIHHSFTEFLIDPVREGRSSTETGKGQFPVIKTKETHRLLAVTCLKYLTSGRLTEWKVEKRTWEQEFLTRGSDSSRRGGIKMLHPFLDYAAFNICGHVAKLESSDKALFAALDDFMKPGNHEFVSWIDFTGTRDLIEVSALHIAAYRGMVNYCQHLIELGHVDINGLDANSRTPISWASGRGHVDIVKILLQNGANADPDDKAGLKPLHYAAMANHSAVVKILLAAGVDPLTPGIKKFSGGMCGNAPSARGHTPLMYACQGGGVESVLEFMTYISSKDLHRALAWAASGDKANVVIALLESPCKISIDSMENDRGSTALFYAAEVQNPGMIRALLEKGADPNARSRGLSEEMRLNLMFWGQQGEASEIENPGATPLHAVTGLNNRLGSLHAVTGPNNRQSWILDKEDTLRECCELLLDAGGDVNAVDDKWGCPIHYCESPAITSMLLQRGSKATVESKDGSTPLHIACEKIMDDSNRGNLIELFVRHNADINAKRRVDGKTPLHLLVTSTYERLTIKKFLAYKPDVNAGDDVGNTPLHLAVREHLAQEFIQDLLDAGADPNKANFNMETPIHTITPSSTRPDVVRILVNAGANLEARDNLGRTALLRQVHGQMTNWATSQLHRDLKFVQKLLKLGAKVDARDINGNSVLHLVCQKPVSPDFVRYLIKAGADPKWINYEGNTLLHEASSVTGVFWNEKWPERLRFLDILLELGVPSRQTNYSGATALHIACSTIWESGHADVRNRVWKGIIDLLAGPRFNIGINEGDKYGIRAIHLAASLSEQLVGWLVERGADPAVRTGEGRTPLQVACRARQTNVVGQLLELYQGQNSSHVIDWKDDRGRTALHDAAGSGRPETVKLLLDAGADPNTKDCEGLTPLHVCSEFSLSEKILWSSQSKTRRDRPLTSVWTEIQSEHDTTRIRDSIRLLLARGADVGALSKLNWTPLDSALSGGCEVMVDELLPATKKAFDEGRIIIPRPREFWRGGSSAPREPFAEQFLRLKNKHSPGILRDLVKKDDDSFEWNKLLRLDDEVLIDELIDLQVDFLNQKSKRESFPETLVRWGYGTLLEKFGPQVSMYHEQMSKESDVDRRTVRSLKPLLHIACHRELPNMEVVMVLVDKLGVDVNARAVSREGPFDAGPTALHVLAEGRYWWQKGAVEFLLQRGADIEMKNEKGESPLSVCVGSNDNSGFWRDAVADVLLKHGANPDSVANDGLTCLNKAGSNSEMVRKLVKHGANISSGDTPALFTAIAKHDLTTVTDILKFGAGCNVRRKSDHDDTPRWARGEEVRIPATEVTPLQYASSSLQNTEDNRESALPVVRLLLEKGADPYELFDGDKTVVHHLLEFGGIVQPFLELPRLDLEHRDPRGRTLLLAGCRSNFSASHALNLTLNEKDPTVASILYGMGADITARDNKGMNALHHLLQTIPFNKAYMETFSVFIKDAPLLVHQKDLEGDTPLHYALRRKHIWYIQTLLSGGAHPLEPDSSGNTALHHLAKGICADPTRSEETQLFKRFLTLGVPINSRNEDGETPLFQYIAVSDHEEINLRSMRLRDDLTIFEEAGADFLARNNNMETVLHIAAKKTELANRLFGKVYHPDYNKEHVVDRFRFLIELGCDPLAEDVNQMTALDVAAACGNEKILKLFQRGDESKVAPKGGLDLF